MKKNILWSLYLLAFVFFFFPSLLAMQYHDKSSPDASSCGRVFFPVRLSLLSASSGSAPDYFSLLRSPRVHRDSERIEGNVSKGAGYSMQLHQGQKLGKFARFIAEQRVTMFAEYPYLYQAAVEDDMPYTTWFSQLPKSAAVVAYYEDKPIGFIAGTSFKDFGEHFQGSVALFEDAQLNPESYFYISEVIIIPEHRGEGLSTQLFEVIENYAKQAGYTKACFVTESHKKHPLKPANYRDLGVLWTKLGYSLMNLFLQFSWPTLQTDGSSEMQEHTLEYWQKDL
jgi:GNAT superfamily N-acetyltransferase